MGTGRTRKRTQRMIQMFRISIGFKITVNYEIVFHDLSYLNKEIWTVCVLLSDLYPVAEKVHDI